MKKILITLLSLSAASFAFAGGEACKYKAAKCEADCKKECCSKDAKACADNKDCKDEAKKDTKSTDTAEKK